MSLPGVKATNLPLAGAADAVLVVRGGAPRQMEPGQLSAQLGAINGPSYETRIQLFADLAWAAGSIGKVLGDTTLGYRGVYKKSGASGSGAWARIGPLPEADAEGLAAEVTATRTATTSALAELAAIDLVTRPSGASWVVSWASAAGMYGNQIVTVAALPETTLPPTECLYIDLTAASPYSVTQANASSLLRADFAAGRKLPLLYNGYPGALSGALAAQVRSAASDAVLAASDRVRINAGKAYPLRQAVRNGVTSAAPAGAWRDALLDVRVEGAVDGEVYHIGLYENGVAGSPGEGWIIQAFNAATMASVNAPVTLVARAEQQTPIVRGAGIQTVRIVPSSRQDMAFVLTLNPDALPASGTIIDSASASGSDGWSWIIDPSCYARTPADTALIAEIDAAANIVPNARLVATGTPPVLTSAAIIAPAETALSARGIERAYEVGAGGVPFFERIGIPYDLAARVAHLSAYIWSETGTHWPSLVQVHRFAAGVSQGVINLAAVEQLSTNLRRVSGTMVVPAGEENNEFRFGVPGGGLASGARAQAGGYQILLASRPVSAFRVPRDRWNDQYKGSNLALAFRRANPASAKMVATFGDSVYQTYGIPEGVAARLGCQVLNLGFGGTRMVWDNRTSGTLYMYKKWFSATALADAIASGDWSNQIAAAQGLYDDPGRGPTDDYRAITATMSTLDWTKFNLLVFGQGTNDHGGSILIGDDADEDLTHFRPAVKNVIAKTSSALPNTRICFAMPMWRGPRTGTGDSNDAPNSAGLWLRDYQDTIIECAARAQVPVIPLHLEVGINVHNSLTLTLDDLHPSAAGRERIADALAAGLRRLL
ncbi:SGNH/GDSL hydrolase family protein [Shinella sp.]|uniref:SGNH/GDSL hydrolase family protein n=1 Tax=Shinella sp. TaxID=1870904 RepID=UPI002583511C|nr:SGNH/GDSL hydrolase family protein [Shinella sp.]MCW5711257.1 SGNH/GDSL hydrolase family protein [Shinella sp.]